MNGDNESNLMQQREDRRTLEKMRRKLATSGHMGKNNVVKAKSAKSSLRIWPFAAIAVVLLLGLNFFLHTQQDKVASAMGGKVAAKPPLAPPAGASLDDQARFWAYEAYDVPKLKAHYNVPKGAVINAAEARRNLELLLPENLGTEVRNEIFALQQTTPQPKAPVAVAKPAPAPAKAPVAPKK